MNANNVCTSCVRLEALIIYLVKACLERFTIPGSMSISWGDIWVYMFNTAVFVCEPHFDTSPVTPLMTSDMQWGPSQAAGEIVSNA